MSLVAELKRRNVFKVALLYLVTGWLVLQAADVVLPWLAVPDWGPRLVLVILALGFVPALAEGVRNGWQFLRIDPTLREFVGHVPIPGADDPTQSRHGAAARAPKPKACSE